MIPRASIAALWARARETAWRLAALGAWGPRRDPAAPRRDRGFLLVGLLTAILVMGILSGVAIQDWSIVEKREKEAELLFIQEQYAAAILAYQKGQGALPTQLDQLTKKGQSNQMYLRRPFVDPMTRGAKLSDWCLWMVGGGNQVVDSCAAEGEGGTGAGAPGTATDTTPDATTRGGGSRDASGGSSGFGRSSWPSGTGPGVTQGQGPGPAAPTPAPGSAGAGGIGGAAFGAIIGVHSKSTEKAYNTVKRGEETYNRWKYTTTDYQAEQKARAIPGLPTTPTYQPGRPSPTGTQPGAPGVPSSGSAPGGGR